MAEYNKQVIRKIKKALEETDFKDIAELRCSNEAQTRQFLIEPFFELLGYSYRNDLISEYNADFGNRESKKVDYAIIISGKQPQMIVEAKKYGKNLNDKDAGQLNNYFVNTNSAKIGILTNGMKYMFYAKDSSSRGLNPKPFFEFDLEDYDSSSIDELSMFYRNFIEINDILKEAEDVYFLNKFEESFYQEMSNPSQEFIKAIYSRMGGKRISEKVSFEIHKHINSISLKSAYDRLVIDESKKSNSGIITTEEELKAFHVIKTLLAQDRRIDTNKVDYRDYKSFFNVLFEGNTRKNICTLTIKPNSKKIDIQGEKFDISDIDSIVKLKKKLVDSALNHI